MSSIRNPAVLKIRYRMPKCSPKDQPGSNVHDPNLWFWRMFPEAAHRFGPGFVCATYEDVDGLTHFVPIELNQDAWAYALGGDTRLGHRVVYYLPENAFWYFDPRFDCYYQTSEEKIKALLSYYFIKCSQELGWLAEIRPLAIDFRKESVLQDVLERAKALLAADDSFFSGVRGHARMINGRRIEPTAKPPYQLFVERALTPAPSNPLTVTEAFSRYFKFCKANGFPVLSRQQFRSLVAEVIREEFNLGIRKDVRGPAGKNNEGWLGIATRPLEEIVTGMN